MIGFVLWVYNVGRYVFYEPTQSHKRKTLMVTFGSSLFIRFV